mgnify:CR=1 FL=1
MAVIVPATKESEAGVLPDAKILDAMTRFNEELASRNLTHVILELGGKDPMIVLEELDAGKKGMSEAARNVRQVSRFLDDGQQVQAQSAAVEELDLHAALGARVDHRDDLSLEAGQRTAGRARLEDEDDRLQARLAQRVHRHDPRARAPGGSVIWP